MRETGEELDSGKKKHPNPSTMLLDKKRGKNIKPQTDINPCLDSFRILSHSLDSTFHKSLRALPRRRKEAGRTQDQPRAFQVRQLYEKLHFENATRRFYNFFFRNNASSPSHPMLSLEDSIRKNTIPDLTDSTELPSKNKTIESRSDHSL